MPAPAIPLPLQITNASQPAQKQLKRHILSFLPDPSSKLIESIRFRSVAFALPTASASSSAPAAPATPDGVTALAFPPAPAFPSAADLAHIRALLAQEAYAARMLDGLYDTAAAGAGAGAGARGRQRFDVSLNFQTRHVELWTSPIPSTPFPPPSNLPLRRD